MTHLLVNRDRLIRFYQSHARIVNAVFRFLLSFITFFSINQLIGYNPVLRAWYVVLAFSVVNTVLPISVLLFLAAAYTVCHVYSVSVSLALVILLIFLIAYLVYHCLCRHVRGMSCDRYRMSEHRFADRTQNRKMDTLRIHFLLNI